MNALREELTVKENALEEMKKAVKEVSLFSTRNVEAVASLSNKQTNRQTNKQTDRQTNKQTNKQADRYTGKQTN